MLPSLRMREVMLRLRTNSDFAIQSGLHVNDLSITSTGAVTDLGSIDIDGTLDVSASGQQVILNGNSNDITGAVTLTGAAVTLTNTTATSIGGINASSLDLSSGGAITDTAGWIILGSVE